MKTVDDIRFDPDYNLALDRFVLLAIQCHTGPSPVVALPNALQLSFVDVFRDLIRCQQHIQHHNRKMFTLVTSDQEINDWNNQIDVIDHNIDKLYIFCHTFSQFIQMKQWNGCYRSRLKDVYLSNEIDFQLIRLGVDHVRTVMLEFHGVQRLRRKFCEDGKRLSQALHNYFQEEIDALDNM